MLLLLELIRAGGLAVRTGIHEDRAFLGEERIGVRFLQRVRANLAATHRDMGVLACLQRGAGDVHIYLAVDSDARMVMTS